MDDIEVFRLSAEACSVDAQEGAFDNLFLVVGYSHGIPVLRGTWEPFHNAEQRWQCVEKLLEMGYAVCFGFGTRDHRTYNPAEDVPALLDCPASEFPARALCALWGKK